MSYVTDWAEEFSDAEDDWPIGNPEASWKEAERTTAGYSRTRGGTYAQSRYYYRKKDKQAAQDQERIRKEHKTLEFYFKASSQPHTPATIRAKSDPQEFGAESAALVLKEALAKDISEFDVWADVKLKNAGKIWATRIKLARSLLKLEQKKPEFSSLPDSLTLADSVEKGVKYARQLRRWVSRDWKIYYRVGIPKPKINNHARRHTILEDEEVITAVREYLNNNGWQSTLQGVVQAVEDVTGSRRSTEIMGLQEVNSDTSSTTISPRTAARWLAKIGWVYDRDGKGYVDGHAREDVAYRNNVFLPNMAAFEPELSEFDENGAISKLSTRFVLVTHDESTFSANDVSNYHWKEKGTQPLKSKSRGKGLMVSDFLTADDGRLRYQHSITGVVEQACQIITYGSGKSDDRYWTAENMISQVKEKAIPIFEKRFPGKKAIFAFDNSSGNAAFAEDALVASRMNLNPGGAQPKMRDMVFAGQT